jgi:hypothetical protein
LSGTTANSDREGETTMRTHWRDGLATTLWTLLAATAVIVVLNI